MTPTPTSELWHRAGRAARDDRKRLIALYGVLLTPPSMVVASMAHRLAGGEGLAPAALRRPIAYVLDPVRAGWMHDQALSVLLWLFLQALVLAALWGLFGGAIARLAAVDVSTGRRESGGSGLAFARRHWRGFAGARAALWAAPLLPLAGAILLATTGRLGGLVGGLAFPVAAVVAAVLVLVTVVAGSLTCAAGFLAAPTIACEDSDAFDAVSRVFGYAAAGLPRLVGVRLLFLGGVLLGAGWRCLRAAGTLAVGALALEAGAGSDRVDRMLAALGAVGHGGPGPALADLVPALALALFAGALVAWWLADLVTRVVCGRVGAYLALRQAVDRVPTDRLRTAGSAEGRVNAEAAGFVEVARIGAPTRRPTR